MKKKLRIQELKIQSFITELDSSLAKTAKGGDDPDATTPVLSAASAVLASAVAYYTMISTLYGAISRPQSLFPYSGSTECTKITTTTTTTSAPHHP